MNRRSYWRHSPCPRRLARTRRRPLRRSFRLHSFRRSRRSRRPRRPCPRTGAHTRTPRPGCKPDPGRSFRRCPRTRRRRSSWRCSWVCSRSRTPRPDRRDRPRTLRTSRRSRPRRRPCPRTEAGRRTHRPRCISRGPRRHHTCRRNHQRRTPCLRSSGSRWPRSFPPPCRARARARSSQHTHRIALRSRHRRRPCRHSSEHRHRLRRHTSRSARRLRRIHHSHRPRIRSPSSPAGTRRPPPDRPCQRRRCRSRPHTRPGHSWRPHRMGRKRRRPPSIRSQADTHRRSRRNRRGRIGCPGIEGRNRHLSAPHPGRVARRRPPGAPEHPRLAPRPGRAEHLPGRRRPCPPYPAHPLARWPPRPAPPVALGPQLIGCIPSPWPWPWWPGLRAAIVSLVLACGFSIPAPSVRLQKQLRVGGRPRWGSDRTTHLCAVGAACRRGAPGRSVGRPTRSPVDRARCGR